MVTIRPMTPADLPAALRLTEQAGWNQIQADWRRFLDLEPGGCFVAEQDRQPAGVTVTCVFGSVAWVAMVLVDDMLRRRGIATELITHALAFLEKQGVATIRLDATDMGKRVYEPLGFIAEFQVTRYGGTARAARAQPRVIAATPDGLPALIALDARAAGIDRGMFLTRLFAESPCPARVLYEEDAPAGFIMARPGVGALQVGPCIASAQAGPALMEDMVHRCGDRRVFLDIPSDHTAAVRVAETLGLTARRTFTRMFRGTCPTGDRHLLWCSSGPEKG